MYFNNFDKKIQHTLTTYLKDKIAIRIIIKFTQKEMLHKKPRYKKK